MRSLHNLAISIVFLSVLMGLPIACSRRPSDETIAKDIQDKIATDPDTKDSQVNVAANQGKVTLNGQVKTPTVQQRVEQIAHEEPGAAGVNDQTTVEPEPTPAQAMAPVPSSPPLGKPKPQPTVVPAGTVLTVRTGQALSSKTSHAGQTFLATLAQELALVHSWAREQDLWGAL